MFSRTHKNATRGRGKASPVLFENQPKVSQFLKKGPDCVHLCVDLCSISIQNVVLRVPRRNVSKMFPYLACFSCVFDEIFTEVP